MSGWYGILKLVRCLLDTVFDEIDKIIEQVATIVGAGGAFRVVLNREGGLALHLDAFNGTVVEIDVGDLYPIRLHGCLAIYTEAVVLRGDLALASDQILDRMIEPTMAVVHLVSWQIIGACQ